MLLNIQGEIDKLKDEELRPILRQMLAALNTLSEKKGYFTKDVVIDSDKYGFVVKRGSIEGTSGDGHYLRLKPTGQGSSTTTSWIDLGPVWPKRED